MAHRPRRQRITGGVDTHCDTRAVYMIVITRMGYDKRTRA